jgi:predicted nucleotidyltransferase
MIPLVRDNLDQIAELCRKYGVERLDVFGSATNGTFDEATSDVDFLVSFIDYSPGIARRFIYLADDLESLLKRPVDLVTERSIRNPIFRRSVDRSREVVFDERRLDQAS